MLCAQFVCVLLCPCTLYVELEPRTFFFLRNQLAAALQLALLPPRHHVEQRVGLGVIRKASTRKTMRVDTAGRG